MKEVLLMEFNP